MGINQDSSQEDESFISSDDGNNDGSSINWSEINSTDENEIDEAINEELIEFIQKRELQLPDNVS